MKISTLLQEARTPEDKIRKRYEKYAKKYPIILIGGIGTFFANNLPKDISEDQIQQLIKLSFTQHEINEMRRCTDGIYSECVFKVDDLEYIDDWINVEIDHEQNPDYLVLSWQQIVDQVQRVVSTDVDFKS